MPGQDDNHTMVSHRLQPEVQNWWFSVVFPASRCSSLLMEHIHNERASQNEAERSRTYSTEANGRAENAASVIMCDLRNCKKG